MRIKNIISLFIAILMIIPLAGCLLRQTEIRQPGEEITTDSGTATEEETTGEPSANTEIPEPKYDYSWLFQPEKQIVVRTSETWSGLLSQNKTADIDDLIALRTADNCNDIKNSFNFRSYLVKNQIHRMFPYCTSIIDNLQRGFSSVNVYLTGYAFNMPIEYCYKYDDEHLAVVYRMVDSNGEAQYLNVIFKKDTAWLFSGFFFLSDDSLSGTDIELGKSVTQMTGFSGMLSKYYCVDDTYPYSPLGNEYVIDKEKNEMIIQKPCIPSPADEIGKYAILKLRDGIYVLTAGYNESGDIVIIEAVNHGDNPPLEELFPQVPYELSK